MTEELNCPECGELYGDCECACCNECDDFGPTHEICDEATNEFIELCAKCVKEKGYIL